MTIDKICKEYGIKNYTINDDGSIDVDDVVDLSYEGLTELPLRFNKVTGYFNCFDNKLTSLKGSPKWVGGYFSCEDNLLTSLEFSPDYIEMDFLCNDNRLTSLVGSPKHVGGDFVCSDNEDLNNITGCTEKIGKYFFL